MPGPRPRTRRSRLTMGEIGREFDQPCYGRCTTPRLVTGRLTRSSSAAGADRAALVHGATVAGIPGAVSRRSCGSARGGTARRSTSTGRPCPWSPSPSSHRTAARPATPRSSRRRAGSRTGRPRRCRSRNCWTSRRLLAVDARRQPVLGRVRQRERLVQRVDRMDRRERREQLVAEQRGGRRAARRPPWARRRTRAPARRRSAARRR